MRIGSPGGEGKRQRSPLTFGDLWGADPSREEIDLQQDNAQAKMPGFRDRIAHVCLGPDEGGLNLDMPRLWRPSPLAPFEGSAIRVLKS